MPWNSKTSSNVAIQRWNRAKRRSVEPFPIGKLENHTFTGENFSGSNFSKTDFTNVIFDACTLDRCSFRGISLHECIFYGGSLRLTMFENTSLSTCLFIDIDLRECLINNKTQLPNEYSWMKTLYYKSADREAQIYLWKNYPKTGTIDEREDFVAMAELEHGANL